MKLLEPETAAPTPLAIGLALGVGLLALLLVRPDLPAAALAVVAAIDAGTTRLGDGVGDQFGRALVRYPLLSLALAGVVVWAVRRERSRDQRSR